MDAAFYSRLYSLLDLVTERAPGKPLRMSEGIIQEKIKQMHELPIIRRL